MIRRIRFGAEAELEDAHGGQAKGLAEPHIGRSDVAQVLGDHGPRTKLALHGRKQLEPRGLHPTPTSGGASASGDGPGAGKAQEMIDANGIEQLEHARKPPQPPGKPRLFVPGPVILGMAPKLSLAIEAIRWITRDTSGLTPSIKLEQLPMAPNVGTVVSDEDGQVANQSESTPVGVCAQRPPLAVELELDEAMARHFVRHS